MRCYVPPDRWSAETMTLDAEERHHLVDVLRAEVGLEINVFDGAGREAVVKLEHIGRRDALVRMIQQRQHPPPPVAFTLIQAVPREQRMDLILQKATELGVAVIQPVMTDHAVVRLSGKDDGKLDRWNRIVLNAAKQCGTPWLPRLDPVRPVLDVLASPPPADLLLACSLEPDARPLRDVLRAAPAPRRISLLIGPEGDFSGREYAAARAAGARPVTFGASVLRVETAALYALSVLRYEFS